MNVLLGSVTDLQSSHRGQAVLAGSHGARASGVYALKFGITALICHDAGTGRDEAGVAALPFLDLYGVPAASVAHTSARIGDARDMARRGRLSRANGAAIGVGIREGMSVAEAFAILDELEPSPAKADLGDDLSVFRRFEQDGLVIADSASAIAPDDDGRIVITGSHGGLPGGAVHRALKARPALAAFNDAGCGIDQAGIARLPVLEGSGIAAICVDCRSARIGDGLSSYETGIVSFANGPAHALGAEPGVALGDIAKRMIELEQS